MKVKVKQKEDFHFIGKGSSPLELPIDAAPHVGGKGRGFRPPELLMYSVAGCMGIHVYEALLHAGKHVESVEVETDGERRDDFPKVYTKIMLKLRMKGRDLTDKDVKDAIQTALTKTCSIAYMVNQAAPISCEYQIE
ncbi:MAG: OsmC family protein [Candidatus Bathyarchaeia archaeon]